MNLRALAFVLFFVFTRNGIRAQDYFSYGGGNFEGLQQVIANPANAADNRLKFDMILGGFDMNFNNSWFAVKREALEHSGTFRNPSSLVFPDTWQNETPNTPGNIYKNFKPIGTGKTRNLIVENRILLPSIMYQINNKNALAFTWSVRQIGNLDGVSPQLAGLLEGELDLSLLQDNVIKNKNLSAVQMAWAEYGITYARVLKDNNQHFLKAGITPKLLQGLEAGYFMIPNLDLLLSTKDTLSYFTTNFSYAHSANLGSPFKNGRPVADFYHYVTRPALGLDLGFVYEWRPRYRDMKYKPDGKNWIWRNDLNKYKFKFSASLVDIGRIKFKTQGKSYAVDFSVNQSDILGLISAKSVEEFDSIIDRKFPVGEAPSQFAIALPTAFNTQADFAINRFFYLNLSTHITNLRKSNLFRVHNYSAICFAPRVEHYWFNLSLPFTYNSLSAARGKPIATGINLRLGPFSVGTTDLSAFRKGDRSSINFYAILKLSIPYKHINDRDADGVKDKKDLCPDDKGEVSLNGCPDKDHDKIPDKDDACPTQPGLPAFKGCPDTDGDGIQDSEDRCPDKKGMAFLKGCPDMDRDSIPDRDDACPDKAGLRRFKGCPDTDLDGIIDKEDFCPTKKGLAKHHGCPDSDGDQVFDDVDQCVTVKGAVDNKGCPWPDTDNDGVIDKLDSCITVPGEAAYKGCPPPPEPVVVAPAEKRILEKAYDNLEFKSGKDEIKASSIPYLKALAKLLKTHKSDWKLKLGGHTDDTGSDEKNMVLSEKRAKAVLKYLLKQKVPAKNMEVEWFGESKPIASNETKEGKRKNRRVEMTVITVSE